MKFPEGAWLHESTVRDAERHSAEGRQARRRKPVRRRPAAVTEECTIVIDRRVLREALRIARGNKARLELCRDGSVIVYNNSRRNGK